MIKVKLSNDNILRVHYKAPQRIITKAVQLANEFINGNLLPRKLSNGKFLKLPYRGNSSPVSPGDTP